MSVAVTEIGIRELQRDMSRIVRDVEQTGSTYRVTLQGRPTRVVLGRDMLPARGVSVEALRDSPLYGRKSPAVIQAQLAELERSRNAAGAIGGAP